MSLTWIAKEVGRPVLLLVRHLLLDHGLKLKHNLELELYAQSLLLALLGKEPASLPLTALELGQFVLQHVSQLSLELSRQQQV